MSRMSKFRSRRAGIPTAVRLKSSGNPAARAWPIYRFSLLYLAVVFFAMAADRVLTR